ncbi:hypothetical protein ACFS5L_44255 [Streptomyces phyllanthi]|uniref:C2H2-type domain-containing protein n=1 Tax=Streptomyces phyllanthi TaxID=1803180 RepID=A0A5N8WCI6_9ACTN|nr:hypothetical protein [Streptomyces phyllanthi]MPY44516.1 hypothetical protein [Streptomyces phyllanthi]
MTEISGQTGHRGTASAVVHESYSFACMRCGHGWEQSYEIEHHIDGNGQEFVMYVADGEVVPSPLSRPTCQNCDNHVVRIMRAGQVSSVQSHLHRQSRRVPRQIPGDETSAGGESTASTAAKEQRDHHWHLSDLLHPFHRKAS